MKILTAEIQLRDETRGLEQAKLQLKTEKYTRDATDNALNFSLCVLILVLPSKMSPVFKLKRLI